MLGIIFTGGEGPPPEVVRRLVDEGAKGALVVAADSGLMAVERAGVKADLIVGDMDSLDDQGRLASYPPECVMRHGKDKDYTDTELAFSLAVEKKCDTVWIIGGGGGRIDHLFAIRSLFEREIFPNRWITETADIRCVNAGGAENTPSTGCDTLRVCLEKGTQVSVFPLGGGPWEAKSGGLKWPLAGLRWDRGFFGLSNVAVDGEFSISAQEGRFMVILPLIKNKELQCLR